MNNTQAFLLEWIAVWRGWLVSPQFYAQVAAVLAAWLLAKLVARQLLTRVPMLRQEPEQGRFLRYQRLLYSCRKLIAPLLFVVLMAIAVSLADQVLGSSWLIRTAQSLALVWLLHAVIVRFVTQPVVSVAARWIGLPLAAIAVLGHFDAFSAWLDSIAFEAGNIRVSALAVGKAAIFGGGLFWLGRASSSAAQKVIRDQQSIDIQTRELAAKALEILVFCIAGLLFLNLLGLELTTLAVFGGALGVGLGFGLQQIAANFISGIILLLERSLKVGDYVELDDGRAGTLKEINMRSSVLATFDGKEIMVPNEKFITTRFINWTKSDPQQRYEVAFAVDYATDLHLVPPLIAKAVAGHPAVLNTPEPPSVELRGFAVAGVNFAVVFWVSGLDDGPNKFTSAIRFRIWDALKGAGISMPVPAPAVPAAPPPPPPRASRQRKDRT